jgi:hypothetical protein
VPRLEALEDRTVPSAFHVVNNLDSGPGSLRQAVLDANAAPGTDTIDFDKTVHQITLTSGELAISGSLNVVGPGANKLAVSGNDASRVFDIVSGSVTISGLTVTHGLANGGSPGLPSSGGGILNRAGAGLNLTDITLAGNRAVGDPSVVIPTTPVFNLAGGAVGGGVANFGTLTVTGGTFTGNQARGPTTPTAPPLPSPARPSPAMPRVERSVILARRTSRPVSSSATSPRPAAIAAATSPASAVAAPSTTMPPSASAAARSARTRPSAATTTSVPSTTATPSAAPS